MSTNLIACLLTRPRCTDKYYAPLIDQFRVLERECLQAEASKCDVDVEAIERECAAAEAELTSFVVDESRWLALTNQCDESLVSLQANTNALQDDAYLLNKGLVFESESMFEDNGRKFFGLLGSS